jgi:hypothetical protein
MIITKSFASFKLSLCLFAPLAQGAISLSSSSNLWTSLGANYDFLSDQQTGAKAGDIVGDGDNSGFFTSYDPGTAVSDKDGILSFRVRLDDAGGNANAPQFDRVLWIGMDADLNGSIDVFLGVNRSGSVSSLGIHAPGPGDNVSPNTTTISSAPYYTESLSGLNYDYRPVGVGDGGTTIDLTDTTTGDVDWYVSFQVPFTSVTAFLDALPEPIDLTNASQLRYIVATSTQANSLNQDLGGIQGSLNSATTWEDLGGFTTVINPSGSPIPEPGACILMATASLMLYRRRRRRLHA